MQETPNIPVVSIILPTFNRGELLVRAIDSVRAQTDPRWELLIVDDCSTIDTFSFVQSRLNRQIRFVRTPHNMGPSGARNCGIAQASPASKFIAFLDDDDAFHPTFVAVTLKHLLDAPPEIGFAWTGINKVYPDQNKVVPFFWDPPFRNKEEAYLGFLEKRYIGTGYGITVKKEVFGTVGGFDESLRAVVDTDFFLRVLQHYFYIKIPDVLIDVYHHRGAKVNSASVNRINALQTIMKKHEMSLRRQPRAWFNFKSKVVGMYYSLGLIREGRSFWMRSLKNERFSVKLCVLSLKLEVSRFLRSNRQKGRASNGF